MAQINAKQIQIFLLHLFNLYVTSLTLPNMAQRDTSDQNLCGF